MPLNNITPGSTGQATLVNASDATFAHSSTQGADAWGIHGVGGYDFAYENLDTNGPPHNAPRGCNLTESGLVTLSNPLPQGYQQSVTPPIYQAMYYKYQYTTGTSPNQIDHFIRYYYQFNLVFPRWRCASGGCELYDAVYPNEGYATLSECQVDCGGIPSSSSSSSSESGVSSSSQSSFESSLQSSSSSGSSAASDSSQSSLDSANSSSSVGSRTSSLSSGGSGSSGNSGSSLSSGSNQSSTSSGSSSSSCAPCIDLPVPLVSQVNFAGFVVTAPSNIPYGTKLQLQLKLEGVGEWSSVGEPVGGGETVPVQQLQPLTGYWVRWTQVQ